VVGSKNLDAVSRCRLSSFFPYEQVGILMVRSLYHLITFAFLGALHHHVSRDISEPFRHRPHGIHNSSPWIKYHEFAISHVMAPFSPVTLLDQYITYLNSSLLHFLLQLRSVLFPNIRIPSTRISSKQLKTEFIQTGVVELKPSTWTQTPPSSIPPF
jgi:hypothetical protein